MFRNKEVEPQVLVSPIGSIVLMDGKYFRVETYGLVEVPQPQLIPEPESE